ncbi:hypothetical protein SAMN05216410_3447 [Sanguibacter gelidistatuariae]|uniref:Heavy-metal-associated domain-containing protein n=1 Tax=Sanguibacter gelidistatuariae TaxID=1814289 RepID=A0A1G6VJZ7_9MICO|nr:heavy metal-binding domain-containing protein [Sanguibacter gelidistatuariae]SDD53357.1 hypothetical protein SAMN05216410_3447 [Sanguibacter gelidistatuariae]
MKTGARLSLYGVGLVVAFGGAFGVAGVVVPNSAVAQWAEGTEMNGHDEGHDPEGAGSTSAPAETMKGLSLGSDGYLLSPVAAPAVVGATGELSFQIHDAAGAPVTQYSTAHDRDLHLVVVRADGSQFRHVHPVLDESTGTWAMPWEWGAAGSYRVIADFTPAGADTPALTLTRAVQVAGEFTPVASQPTRVAEVDGFTVSLDGEIVAGSPSELTLTVARDGEPVTALEPYLGAFGHLVALREGDLAFLHVHAEGATPQASDTAGPDIVFAAQAPTAGRYLLYLDFQVDGEVHTAEFVLDAAHGAAGTGAVSESHPDGH